MIVACQWNTVENQWFEIILAWFHSKTSSVWTENLIFLLNKTIPLQHSVNKLFFVDLNKRNVAYSHLRQDLLSTVQEGPVQDLEAPEIQKI